MQSKTKSGICWVWRAVLNISSVSILICWVLLWILGDREGDHSDEPCMASQFCRLKYLTYLDMIPYGLFSAYSIFFSNKKSCHNWFYETCHIYETICFCIFLRCTKNKGNSWYSDDSDDWPWFQWPLLIAIYWKLAL